jgi:hypothetical protein
MKESALDTMKKKMEIAEQLEHLFEFNYYIVHLREILGRSRASVCHATGMSYDQLLRLEEGNFLTCYPKRIMKLAEYYGVSENMLEQKCRFYIAQKKLKRHLCDL